MLLFLWLFPHLSIYFHPFCVLIQVCLFLHSIYFLISSLKISAFQFLYLVQKYICWRRKWQSTVVFLLGKSHCQRSLAGTDIFGLMATVLLLLFLCLIYFLYHFFSCLFFFQINQKDEFLYFPHFLICISFALFSVFQWLPLKITSFILDLSESSVNYFILDNVRTFEDSRSLQLLYFQMYSLIQLFKLFLLKVLAYCKLFHLSPKPCSLES